jgi:hypothetical protein
MPAQPRWKGIENGNTAAVCSVISPKQKIKTPCRLYAECVASQYLKDTIILCAR